MLVLLAQEFTTRLGTAGSQAVVIPDFETQILPGFFKVLFVLAVFLYLVFAFVVTRQIKIMRSTVITPFSPVVRIIGYVHLLIAFIIFISFILFL